MRNDFCNSVKDYICMNKHVIAVKNSQRCCVECCLSFVFPGIPAENDVFAQVLSPLFRLIPVIAMREVVFA